MRSSGSSPGAAAASARARRSGSARMREIHCVSSDIGLVGYRAMPRFQLKKSASVTLFWEIDADGAVLKTRFGRVGAESDANETERELPTPVAAQKELKRLIGV